MKPAVRLLIGELAARTGASRRSLRYYETQGLLHAQRGENGYRYYGGDAVTVVEHIKELLDIGLPTRAVRTILPCVLDADPPKMRCPELRRTLRRELERLDTLAAHLDRSRHSIATLLSTATRPDGDPHDHEDRMP